MEHGNQDFSAILQRRVARRGFLKVSALALAASQVPVLSAKATSEPLPASLAFTEVRKGMDAHHHLAPGYQAQTLLRWGDKVMPGAPAFEPTKQSAAAQEQQFGFNNDFIAYFPIHGSSHGLLGINHEYCTSQSMFPGDLHPLKLSFEQHRVEMASVGCSVIEVKRVGQQWQPVYGNYNRRIHAMTPMVLTGPASGHARLQTSGDASGKRVLGTFANCAGGQTPWGTYLTCEENFDAFFTLDDYEGPESENHASFRIGNSDYHRWELADKRFSVAAEPNEPNRFGWVVEIDPFDPKATPKKRTALGRFKHESATVVKNGDGRIVVYSGDDQYFQHIYKFVSNRRVDEPGSKDLLDDGTLYTAQLDEEGKIRWLPLVFGMGPLTPDNGFASQADVLIDVRKAVKLLGATEMDRPEDIEVHPHSQAVYVSLTKNPKRREEDAANRRAPNPMGYILEMLPEGGDHASLNGRWEVLLEGGDPQDSGVEQGRYHTGVSASGWLSCPDNLAIDKVGRLWISTDGQPSASGHSDMLYATEVTGEGRALTRAFFRGPVGCEVTGPCFTPDNATLFVSIQHPAERTGYDNPSTRWPDFDAAMPPRPAILAITKEGGGIIGS